MDYVTTKIKEIRTGLMLSIGRIGVDNADSIKYGIELIRLRVNPIDVNNQLHQETTRMLS